jgi:hypothetical protein
MTQSWPWTQGSGIHLVFLFISLVKSHVFSPFSYLESCTMNEGHRTPGMFETRLC